MFNLQTVQCYPLLFMLLLPLILPLEPYLCCCCPLYCPLDHGMGNDDMNGIMGWGMDTNQWDHGMDQIDHLLMSAVIRKFEFQKFNIFLCTILVISSILFLVFLRFSPLAGYNPRIVRAFHVSSAFFHVRIFLH